MLWGGEYIGKQKVETHKGVTWKAVNEFNIFNLDIFKLYIFINI